MQRGFVEEEVEDAEVETIIIIIWRHQRHSTLIGPFAGNVIAWFGCVSLLSSAAQYQMMMGNDASLVFFRSRKLQLRPLARQKSLSLNHVEGERSVWKRIRNELLPVVINIST